MDPSTKALQMFADVIYESIHKVNFSNDSSVFNCQTAIKVVINQLEAKVAEFKCVSEESHVLKHRMSLVQQLIEELRKKVEVLGSELQCVVDDKDLRAQELAAAQQDVKELKMQLKSKGKQLSAKVSELKDLSANHSDIKELVRKLKDQLNNAEVVGKERLDEAEITLLQLHQVQEELEHYFLCSHDKEKLLLQYKEQSIDLKKIISGLLS